jgi:thioredoxin domain-containing protein 5
VAAENSAAHVGKVDCTVHKSICERFEVRGYPTLLGFKDGATGSSTDAIKYPGGRDLASLKGWLTSNTPAATAADL